MYTGGWSLPLEELQAARNTGAHMEAVPMKGDRSTMTAGLAPLGFFTME